MKDTTLEDSISKLKAADRDAAALAAAKRQYPDVVSWREHNGIIELKNKAGRVAVYITKDQWKKYYV